MPFLTRDLPPGGRHIDRTVPPAVPLAPAAARVRQLLPVGLLVAASSAGVALSPMLGGGTSAVADSSHEASAFRFPGTIPNADYAAGSTQIDRAAYVVSRSEARHAGKHRALSTEARSAASASASTSAVTASPAGGKHRASGTAVETAPATQQAAPKHSAATPAPATTSSATTEAEPATAVSGSASATPSSSATTSTTQQSDVVTSTVNGVGSVVGGVLGTVGGLLGGN